MNERSRGIVNISVNTIHLWAATIVLLLTIGGTLAGGFVTVKDTYDQVVENKENIEDHEQRLETIETSVNDLDNAIRTINELRKSLDEFRTELEDSRGEWTKLYRDFDLKKK